MRRLYKQIRFDSRLKRFYVACTVCSERLYGRKLPLLCLNIDRVRQLEHGGGRWLEQQTYNHTKAVSVQYISRYYNRCLQCGRWICDRCYSIGEEKGCFYCMETQKKET